MSTPHDTANLLTTQAAIYGRLVILRLLINDTDDQRLRKDATHAFHFARLALEAQ